MGAADGEARRAPSRAGTNALNGGPSGDASAPSRASGRSGTDARSRDARVADEREARGAGPHADAASARLTDRPGRRKSADERSAEITAAARELALGEGLSAVTLRGIAARAGVTPALVAHYRPNMDALVAETFATIVSSELREIAQVAGLGTPRAVPTEGTPSAAAAASTASTDGVSATARLGALVATLLDGSRDDVTLVWVEAWALGRRNEALAAAVRAQMDAWQEVVQALLEEGVGRGEFAVDDPAAVAWQLLGMIDGLNAQALVRWGEGRSVLLTHALEGMLGLPRGALAVLPTSGA
jgi:AcrR family transcriptional regulator